MYFSGIALKPPSNKNNKKLYNIQTALKNTLSGKIGKNDIPVKVGMEYL